jgi:hypothetical protein
LQQALASAAIDAEPGANGKAEPTPPQGGHVVNEELLDELAEPITDSDAVASDPSESTPPAPIASVQPFAHTEEAKRSKSDSTQPQSEPAQNADSHNEGSSADEKAQSNTRQTKTGDGPNVHSCTDAGFGAANRFFAYPVEEPPYLVDALLREQQIGSFTADWNLGKTPALTQLTICVGAGLPFLGRTTTKRPVIVLDGETPYADYRSGFERIAKRLSVGPSDVANLRFFLRYGPKGYANSEAFRTVIGKPKDACAFIKEQLKRSPDALVIIDPLMEIIPFKETDPFAAVTTFHQLREILTDFPHAAILFTLHLRKGSDDPKDLTNSASSGKVLLNHPRRWFKEVAGTNKIGAHADVRLGMCSVTDDEQHLVLKGFTRGKDAPLLSFVRTITVDGEYDGFVEHPLPKDALFALADEHKKQLATLKFPFRFNEVADKKDGMPRASLHRLLKLAQSAGCVRKDEHKVWHRVE